MNDCHVTTVRAKVVDCASLLKMTLAGASVDGLELSDTAPLWAQKMILELGLVQREMKEHLPTIQATTSRIESELSSLASRINQAEQRISDVEDLLSPLSANDKALEIRTKELSQKVDCLESYSRRNNLRIVNIPESMEAQT